jgi:hypothetical protein
MPPARVPQPTVLRQRSWLLTLAVLAAATCGTDCARLDASETAPTARYADARPPVGLAIEIDNGVGQPLRIRQGQRFYLNQIDLRASVDTTQDGSVSTLAHTGDFADLRWEGTRLVDEEFVLLANPDGTFTRRRFYRDAAWMGARSTFALEQWDEAGRRLAPPLVVNAGGEEPRRARDDFFVRRLRAIQWTLDCQTAADCAGAQRFTEEALVELRHALHSDRTFVIDPRATHLTLTWSLHPDRAYTIPVTHDPDPPFAYGFSIDLVPVTPPRADGTYAPGSNVIFRITLRDGEGRRLHRRGSLPTYAEVVFGPNPAGIQYYRAFFDPTTTYYRRKHRERMLMSQIIGPAQDVQPIRSIIDLDAFLGPDDVQTVATPERDGVYAQFRTIPTANDLFGGAFDPTHEGWHSPVPDWWTYHLPAGARPGTYLVTVKGRRTYMGEDTPFSRTVEIQVGTPRHTTADLGTGPCTTCHTGPSALGRILHANDDRAACTGCHVPLGFELEGPIVVRTHFIHSRSHRFAAPLTQCASCHLTAESLQRTSKAACLSCHRSYPPSHVDSYGPIESMYVGGGRESFESCTSTCHTNHPGSGLETGGASHR